VAAAAGVLLAVATYAFLLLGPVIETGSLTCSPAGTCAATSASESLGWSGVLVVPVLASALVLAGVVLARWTRIWVPVAGIGCLGLAAITVLGALSIGMFVVPADLAAGAALLLIQQQRALSREAG
jgi:hypothetical protein